jgi:hypothetical protein
LFFIAPMSVMAPLTALVGLALVALQTTGAIAGWTFVWRDKNGQSYVENGALDKPCTRIQHAVGQRFDWERPTTGPDSASCVKLWSSETCSGSPQGFSCSNWEKSATHNIGAFAVTNCTLYQRHFSQLSLLQHSPLPTNSLFTLNHLLLPP